ncbi:hypothetical protein FF38_03794 [Lucilia cuprina]|uniref:Uncharacterized protein n=1 Tax=Lucilia cuprina TaxID=7375 RepID=A0A0L0C1B0_LUCCU|nr:hypothetical protein FF38_03794 [Lucilia cuprina]
MLIYGTKAAPTPGDIDVTEYRLLPTHKKSRQKGGPLVKCNVRKAYSFPADPNPVLVLRKVIASSMDSDLEAFSHNPADGSFAALPDRTAA